MLAIKLVCSFMKDRAKYVWVIFTSLIHGPKVSSLDTHTHTQWEGYLKELGLEKNYKRWLDY